MVNIGGANTGNERRGLSFLVFVGIIGFSIARAIATFFTNYLWFDSVDLNSCLLYTSPSPRDVEESRMPSSA